MDVRSLGYRTDLALRRLGGSVIDDRGDHLVIRTPRNPTFYWGNFLLLARPPYGDSGERWLATFAAEFPGAQHVAIGVDGTDGAVGESESFRAAGLELESSVVLTAGSLAEPFRIERTAELRPLRTDEDWRQVTALRIAVDGDDTAGHRAFVDARVAEMRSLADGGRGVHVGAFVDGVLRAALGVYTDGGGLGRYQHVDTHPDHRRRGLAAGLLALAADLGRRDHGMARFVIVADPDYVAVDLYRRMGFVDAERQVQWQRAPR